MRRFEGRREGTLEIGEKEEKGFERPRDLTGAELKRIAAS
jgi:hypothetical protein